MLKSSRAIKNFLLSSGLFALYQFTVVFILIFSCIRAYPFIYGPLPSEGQSYIEAMNNWNDSYQTLFSILMVFLMIGGFVGVMIVAQSPIELPISKTTRVNIDGEKYEVSRIGNRISITKGVDNSGFAYLVLRTLLGLITIPINILIAIYKFVMCFFSKRYKDAYSNMSLWEYWNDLLRFGEVSLARILYSNCFILVEIILGIIVISLSYQLTYLK